MRETKGKQCSSCYRIFGCAVSNGENQCWCFDYPFIFDSKSERDCFCPNCLKIKSMLKIEQYVATITPQNAVDSLAKDLPKTNKLIEEIDYYLENGNYVFKPWFHLKRGSCCGNNCRHCPYELNK